MKQEKREQNEQTDYQIRVEKKHNYFYRITNQINWKFYYGIHSTDNLDDDYIGSGKLLKKAIKKYKKENFVKTIIADYPTRKDASEHERLAVTMIQVEDEMCYNIKTGGDNEATFKHTEESIKKIRQSGLGRKHSEASKQLMSKNSKGKNCGEAHHNFGKVFSEETKQKMRENALKRVFTQETRQKMSDNVKGKKRKPETIEKMRHNGNIRKPIIVNGILYESILNCSKILNMGRNLIKNRIESTLEIWKNWQYA